MEKRSVPYFTADDWGLSPGVNEGILTLAQKGIVRRVSCMANAPFLRDGLSDLLAVPGLQTGIHYNVTYLSPHPLEEDEGPLVLLTEQKREGRPYRRPSELLSLAMKRATRAPLYLEMKRALVGQLRLLKTAGLPIHYLDGHHHVHLLPGLLRELGPVLLSWEIKTVRLPLDKSLALSRRAPIFWLAMMARPVIRELRLSALPCRYPTLSQLTSRSYLRKLFLDAQSEVIVHPARRIDFKEHGVTDSYTDGRVAEFEALSLLVHDLKQNRA